MALLKREGLLLVIGLAAGLIAGWWLTSNHLSARLADLRASHAEHIAIQQQASADVISRTLLRERQLHKDIDEIQENAETEKQRLAADLADSNAAARRLSEQLDRISGRVGADTATAAECQAAATATGMLAGMLAEFDEAAGIFAEEAARSRSAGLNCEAAYDAARAGNQ